VIAYSDATTITGLLTTFFVLLALIALARSMLRDKGAPQDRRFRVGVFVERDRAPAETGWERPWDAERPDDTLIKTDPSGAGGGGSEAPTRVDEPPV
jgi:hypothetical protein